METNQKPLLESTEGRNKVRDESKKIRDYLDILITSCGNEPTEEHIKELTTMHDVIALDIIMWLKSTWGLEMIDLQ
jgi:hypothetical protein